MSGEEFRLVPLDCPTCGASVAAQGSDVVFYCTACRNGYRFDDESQLLTPVDVAFVAIASVRAERHFPFWVLPATVTISERQSSGGDPAAWLSRFFSGGERAGGTSRGGRGEFAVPAMHASLAGTLELTRRYTQALPELGERLGERLVGGRYGLADAKKLAHFSVVASEVEKRDTLQHLRYDIEFGEARLLGVPFVRDGDSWRDAVHGVGI